MDKSHKRKSIEKQNEAWTKKESKKKDNFPKNHPWQFTDTVVKIKLEKIQQRIESS